MSRARLCAGLALTRTSTPPSDPAALQKLQQEAAAEARGTRWSCHIGADPSVSDEGLFFAQIRSTCAAGVRWDDGYELNAETEKLVAKCTISGPAPEESCELMVPLIMGVSGCTSASFCKLMGADACALTGDALMSTTAPLQPVTFHDLLVALGIDKYETELTELAVVNEEKLRELAPLLSPSSCAELGFSEKDREAVQTWAKHGLAAATTPARPNPHKRLQYANVTLPRVEREIEQVFCNDFLDQARPSPLVPFSTLLYGEKGY